MMALLHDFVFFIIVLFLFDMFLHVLFSSLLLVCHFSSISDCMAMPTGWLFYFLMDWLCHDSKGETKSTLAGLKKG